MNSTKDMATARSGKKTSARLRRAGSLVGGALLGSSIMTPILAGGGAVDGDAVVIVLSGALALLGIGAHVVASAASARASANTASTSSPVRSRCAFARRTRA